MLPPYPTETITYLSQLWVWIMDLLARKNMFKGCSVHAYKKAIIAGARNDGLLEPLLLPPADGLLPAGEQSSKI
ncbi:hypothetical protein SADUNF_Sadunf14G0057600 [Salix dunnii]|uniref:Uncharacterized protein n=1 Tax=Salix dunnii TaxID=1413687 RepID=A0A835JHV2_9ROSI|nr:hypothetical protein SADUNF_Sadunf14G0057600 [Salix dunnii]